ncbi:YggS family pyridoxal phosphate-dependent enzyme [Candidatus Acetothermia bacterium]|nr:YggS family pyridoxal phosphate-dependent enzyme [Candidatus Acetothermia bacterium]
MTEKLIHQNIAEIRERIARACERSGRSPSEIQILAATKTRSVEEILIAAEAGIAFVGENTVQEAKTKFSQLSASLEKHLIGHLQTNKVKPALELFDLIQSVDSLKLAQEIEKRAAQANKMVPVLIEVNVGGEASKFGIVPQETRALVEQITPLSHVHIQGLMAVAPYASLEEVRSHFRRMRELFELLRELANVEMKWLSMGMSHDYEVAIKEGANLVRLGTAIFGLRG